jgi:hypothetical protein
MKRCLFSAYYFPVFFSNRNIWNTSLLVFCVSFSCTCSNRNVWNTWLLVWCYQTFSRTFSKTNSFSSQNLFFTSFIFYLFLLQNVPILQHAIASKSNHSNTMLPNVMVYKSLNMNCLINLLPGWNILIHLTNCWSLHSERLRSITLYDRWYISQFFIWYYVVKHFPSFIKIIIK